MEHPCEQKVALITGGNGGIGLALCGRLLKCHPSLRLILACRNFKKATVAKDALLLSRPQADVHIVVLDVSSVESVYEGAFEIRQICERVDYLFLNAGIMQVTHVDWHSFFSRLFTSEFINMIRTGKGLLLQSKETTPEGLQTVFATNLFGHFALIKEIEDLLAGPDREAHIIWTSSINASSEEFNVDDIQCSEGKEPYASSKHAIDLTSLALNKQFNSKRIYSHVACPGLVLSNMTFGILPSWCWSLLVPFLWLFRIFLPSNTLDPYNGSEALFWLSEQSSEALDPKTKYCSRISILGKRYVEPVRLNLCYESAHSLLRKLLVMENDMRSKYKKL